MDTKIRINIKRLLHRLGELAQHGAMEGGGVSRLALSDAYKAARNLTVSWMKSLGPTVYIDAEYTSLEDLETGANLLLHAALKLANQKE